MDRISLNGDASSSRDSMITHWAKELSRLSLKNLSADHMALRHPLGETGRLNNLSPKNATDHAEKSPSAAKRDVFPCADQQGQMTSSIIVSISQKLIISINLTSAEEFKLLIINVKNMRNIYFPVRKFHSYL